MSNNLVLGRYYSVKSFIHSMNQTSKIICLLLFILMNLINRSFIFGLVLIGVSILVLYLSNIPIRLYLSSLSKLKWFLLLIFLINILLGIGVINNLLIIIKIILLINCLSLLTLTTSSVEIIYGLEKVLNRLNKFKIPVNKVSLKISLILGFIPLLLDEASKVLKTSASRGLDYYNSDIKGKIKILKVTLKRIFKLSIEKMRNKEKMMELRLFSIENRRSNYRFNKWKFSDTICVIIHVILFIIILVKEVF